MNKKILIIQTAFIGDVILTLPLVQNLKSAFPDSHLDFLCIPYTLGVLRGNPNINEIIVYDKHRRGRSKFKSLLEIAAQIRQKKYDIVLIPHRSIRSALIAFFAQIPKRIGFSKSFFSWLYTDTVEVLRDRHEVDKNNHLAGVFSIDTFERIPKFFPKESDINIINRIVNDISKVNHNGMIAIAPGSVWKTKRWPVEYYLTLVNDLITRKYFIILLGGENDKHISGIIAKTNSERIKDLCGELSILQSYLLLKQCLMLVSNDSAAVHLASAAEIPVLDIFGPTIPEFGFSPLSIGSKCLEIKDLNCRPCGKHGDKECPIGTFDCMLNLKPSFVLQQVDKLLRKSD